MWIHFEGTMATLKTATPKEEIRAQDSVRCAICSSSRVPRPGIRGRSGGQASGGFLVSNHIPTDPKLSGLYQKLNDGLRGQIAIEFVGGPEAVPIAQQGNAIKSGVIDLLYSAPTYAAGIFPEAPAFAGSHLTPMERRQNGAIALLDAAVARRLNAKFLMNVDGGEPLHIFLSKEVPRTPSGGVDLKGMKLRSSEQYVPFLIAPWGAIPVVLATGEIYTALERGTVDGIGFSVAGVRAAGWHKLLKSWIEPPMYWTSTYVIMNLPKWNSLPAAAQAAIMTITVAYEKEFFEAFKGAADREKEEFVKAGMKPIKLEGAAAKAYVDAAHDSMWANIDAMKGLEIDRAAVLKLYYGR